jgi:DNA-binding NarL/FixJ family response regulator
VNAMPNTLARQIEQPTPDIAVLDLNLPKNDGLRLLEAISENRAFPGVLVVILSSGLAPRVLAKIQKLNLERFRKPSTFEDFLKIGSSLKGLLERGSLLSRMESKI